MLLNYSIQMLTPCDMAPVLASALCFMICPVTGNVDWHVIALFETYSHFSCHIFNPNGCLIKFKELYI